MTKQRFVSEADVALADPDAVIRALADYWTGYEVELDLSDGVLTAKLGIGTGTLRAASGRLFIRLDAADLGALQTLRSYAVDTLRNFAGPDAPEIVWRGDMEIGRTFADFREVRLVSNVAVAPRLRRLTFTGGDVARFGSETDIHVRLYFPPEGLGVPEWPRPGPDGRTIWPAHGKRPDVRYYTVRRWIPASRSIEIDFVLHEDEGPGCAFAVRAQEGAIVGMAGPVGRGLSPAGWSLLAGDETALPAIARLLESMPRDAHGAAFIEVDAASDEIAIDRPAGVSLRWLHRRGAPAGATDLLRNAVTGASLPFERDPFVWVGCEFATAKAIRKHFKTLGLARDRHLVVGYWQRESQEAEAA